jgi:hypothetical protein
MSWTEWFLMLIWLNVAIGLIWIVFGTIGWLFRKWEDR